MTTNDPPAHFRFPLDQGGELELNGFDELKFWHSPHVAQGRALTVPDMMRLRSALGDRLIAAAESNATRDDLAATTEPTRISAGDQRPAAVPPDDPRVQAIMTAAYRRDGEGLGGRSTAVAILGAADAVDPYRVPAGTTPPTPLDMVHQLHTALYGSSWARPVPPGKVWAALLEVVTELADGAAPDIRGIAP